MSESSQSAETTHFGYRTVDAREKAGMVRGVFDSVASRYDLMNDAMSLGVHRLWKDRFVRHLRLSPVRALLDLAGGTGDIAERFLRTAPENTHAAIVDINHAMLREGKHRAIDGGRLDPRVTRACGDAENLPFGDASFDACTIAFGIRNVTHIDRALAEIHRVLRPGGHFLCLEFSKVANPALAKLYQAYSFQVIPRMGRVLAGDGASYQYLVESIDRFPAPEVFARMIEDAGFRRVSFERLTGGVVAIHSGWKV